MKKVLFLLVVLLSVSGLCFKAGAQAPQGIPYQAVARDVSGNLITTQAIALRFSIHDGNAAGPVVYQETQNDTTNTLGLFSVNLGLGTPVSGTLASVNWGSGDKFLQVELDPAGGTSFTDMGTTQLMSVPYALYAGNSSNGWSTTGNSGTNTIDNALGTNDTTDLVIKTDNFETARLFSNPETGGGLNTPTDRLRLMRSGMAYQKWPMVASFQLGSYEPNLEGRTQLDIALLNGPGVNPDNKVMSLLANGNVGIGNTSPTEKLDVNGNGKFGPYLKIGTDVPEGYFQNSQDGAYRALQSGGTQGYWFQNYNGVNTSMYVGLNGAYQNHVGIGNVTPQHTLSVGEASGDLQPVTVRGYSNDGSWKGGAAFGYNQGSVVMGELAGVPTIGGHNANLSAWNNLAINPAGGNVGIGTSTPTAKLDVAGNVRIADGTEGAGKVLTSDANGITSWVTPSTQETDPKVGSLSQAKVPTWNGSTLQDGIITDNGTNVGIGTTNPYTTLHVMSPFSKNDTLIHDLQVLTSSETDFPYQLSVGMKGSGDLHTRNFYFQTLEHNLYLDGNISLQPYGGKTVIGAELGQHLFQIGGGTDDKQGVNMRSYSNNQPYWKGGAAFGYNQGSVILGELDGIPTIGGHNSDLSNWSNLSINPGGGNVGIGTSNPQSTLHVNNPVGATSIVIGGNPVAGGYSSLSLGVSDLANGHAEIQSISSSGASWGDIQMNKNGGNVLVGLADSVTPSAKFQINSKTQGFLPPRMTQTERDAIITPDLGLMVYCIDCNATGQLQSFDGNKWKGESIMPNGSHIGDMLYWNGNVWDTVSAGNPGQYMILDEISKPKWAGSAYPIVVTNPATNVTLNEGTMSGQLTNNGGSSIIAQGFCWSLNPNPTINDNVWTSTAPISNSISYTITNIPQTKYYFRIWASNSLGVGYGRVDSLNTFPHVVPSVYTDVNISGLLSGQSFVNGQYGITGVLWGGGDAPVTEYGICWGLQPNPTINDNSTTNVVMGTTGGGVPRIKWSGVMDGMLDTNKYYFRAYAKNAAGVGYGNVGVVRNNPPMQAQTTMLSPITLGNLQAQFAVNVIGGGTPITSRGICWSLSPNPTISNNHTTNLNLVDGILIEQMTNINSTSVHYVRPYVKTDFGPIVYGPEQSITPQLGVGDYYAPAGGKIIKLFGPGETGYVAGELHGIAVSVTSPFNADSKSGIAAQIHFWSNNGFSDWRLANVNEMQIMFGIKQTIQGFQTNLDPEYWADSSGACQLINMVTGAVRGAFCSSSLHRGRAVRNF